MNRYRPFRPVCPHCGNSDLRWITDNQPPHSHRPAAEDPDLTFLCLKPCAAHATSFDEPQPEADGSYVCGMQWDAISQEDEITCHLCSDTGIRSNGLPCDCAASKE